MEDSTEYTEGFLCFSECSSKIRSFLSQATEESTNHFFSHPQQLWLVHPWATSSSSLSFLQPVWPPIRSTQWPFGPAMSPFPHEHDPFSSFPQPRPDSWPSDTWTIATASFLKQVLVCGSHCRGQDARFPLCLWTQSSAHFSQSIIKIEVFWHLGGHLCTWSWQVQAPVALSSLPLTWHLLYCGRTDSSVPPPHDPPLLVFMQLCDSFPLGVSRTCDFLLINRMFKGDQ